MRAAELFALGVADAVVEGRGSAPALPAGEDEFVELDTEGRPRSQPGAKRTAPARKSARGPKTGDGARAARRARAKPAPAAEEPAAVPAAAADEAAEEEQN